MTRDPSWRYDEHGTNCQTRLDISASWQHTWRRWDNISWCIAAVEPNFRARGAVTTLARQVDVAGEGPAAVRSTWSLTSRSGIPILQKPSLFDDSVSIDTRDAEREVGIRNRCSGESYFVSEVVRKHSLNRGKWYSNTWSAWPAPSAFRQTMTQQSWCCLVVKQGWQAIINPRVLFQICLVPNAS